MQRSWPRVPLVDDADGEPLPRVNVSVKLTSLYPGFDPIAPAAAKARAKEVLRPLLRKGMEGGAHIHVDMEHYAIKDLTLDVFEELMLEAEFRDYPHFGIVLQAYLRDGDADAVRLVEFAKRRGTPFGCGWSRGRTGIRRRCGRRSGIGRCRCGSRNGSRMRAMSG